MTARLLAGGGISLDQALTSEPFASQRGDIIRASLLTRLRHCTSALCLYGARTAEDDWVRWALETAAGLKLPLLGAALPGEDAWDAERFLTRPRRGAGAAEPRRHRHADARRAAPSASRRAIDAASIAETLHLMRHPLR